MNYVSRNRRSRKDLRRRKLQAEKLEKICRKAETEPCQKNAEKENCLPVNVKISLSTRGQPRDENRNSALEKFMVPEGDQTQLGASIGARRNPTSEIVEFPNLAKTAISACFLRGKAGAEKADEVRK